MVERLVAVEYPKEAPSPGRFLRAGVRKPMGCEPCEHGEITPGNVENRWLKIMEVIMKAATSEQNKTQSHNS